MAHTMSALTHTRGPHDSGAGGGGGGHSEKIASPWSINGHSLPRQYSDEPSLKAAYLIVSPS